MRQFITVNKEQRRGKLRSIEKGIDKLKADDKQIAGLV